MDEVRARVAMRMCAKDRAEERMAAGKPREGIPQREVEEVGDRHLPRKKDGPDETGKDVEGQRGSFGRAGTVEVDDAEKTLDNEEEGIAPCAMDSEEPGTEEGHELVVASGAERD